MTGECHEEVTRKGELEPCEKPAVAMRIDPNEGTPYPVCVKHTRADMVSLQGLRAAIAQEIETQGREAVKWLAEHCVDATDMGRLIGTEDAYKDAIRIVRGEKYGLDDLVGGTP